MALSITGIARENGAACDHLVITVDDDGTSRTLRLSVADAARTLDSYEPNYRVALVLCWLRYKRARGASLASLVGQTVVS